MENSKENDKPKKIDALTGARFTAVMTIVFCHFEFLQKYGNFWKTYNTFFRNATMGVDFFFMLSGFGMMYSSMRKNPISEDSNDKIHTAISYGKKHIKKIYSLYVFTLLIGIIYEFLSGYFDYGQNIQVLIGKSIFFFLIDLTLLQSTTGRTSFSHSLNGVCWFLSCLFCIYLVSPFIIKFLKKHINNIKKAIIGIIISIICSLILAALFEYIDKNSTFFNDLCYGSPYRRVFYVITGMLIAQIYGFKGQIPRNKISSLFKKGIFEYIAISISIVWFFIHNSLYKVLGYWTYSIDMIIVAIDIYALAIGNGKISKFFESKLLVHLGNISMYIFITHYLIRLFVDFFISKLLVVTIEIAVIEAVIILILTFICSEKLYSKKGKIKFIDRIISKASENKV